MIDHDAYLLACRARLLSLVVVTTGTTNLSATTQGYARTAGSFVADGFRAGMEINAVGFPPGAGGVSVVQNVAPLLITVGRPLVAAVIAGARSLTVGAPSRVSWENIRFSAESGAPFAEEQYLPGPMRQITVGPLGWLELEPQYIVHVFVPTGVGIHASSRYLAALLNLFAPGTAMSLANGDILRVRRDVAPFGSQHQNDPQGGWVFVPVTIPLRIQTQNTI